jgi:hypothetical protein
MSKPKKKAKKNPTDPNLLARSVVEAAIGEPLIAAPSSPRKKAKTQGPSKRKQ